MYVKRAHAQQRQRLKEGEGAGAHEALTAPVACAMSEEDAAEE